MSKGFSILNWIIYRLNLLEFIDPCVQVWKKRNKDNQLSKRISFLVYYLV